MNTTQNTATAALARDLVPGQVVKVGPYAGPVVSVGKAPRSPKWSVRIDVGGKHMDFRTEPDAPIAVLPPEQAPTVRDEDHRPNFDNTGGTSCSCGWAPKNRPTRMSMWNAPFNRHARSLGLLGV